MTEPAPRPAWIVDLDGTLALFNGRGPFEWSKVGTDLPNPPVVEIVRALLVSGHDVIPVTGRMRECMGATNRWLAEHVHNRLQVTAERMRPNGDYRPDEQLKRGIYELLTRSGWVITGVIDDRPKVCRMWRSLGLTVFQVDDREF